MVSKLVFIITLLSVDLKNSFENSDLSSSRICIFSGFTSEAFGFVRTTKSMENPQSSGQFCAFSPNSHSSLPQTEIGAVVVVGLVVVVVGEVVTLGEVVVSEVAVETVVVEVVVGVCLTKIYPLTPIPAKIKTNRII